MDCNECNAYYVGETRKSLQSRIRKHQGAVRRRGTTAETGHSFNFENAKAIDHGCLKGERLVKEALHSGPQAFNQCASLPVQREAIPIRTNHKEVRQIKARDRPGARTDPPADEAPTQGRTARDQKRMMAKAGQTRDNPLLLNQLIKNSSKHPLLILR